MKQSTQLNPKISIYPYQEFIYFEFMTLHSANPEICIELASVFPSFSR